MKKENYAEFLKTDYWKKVSRLVKERAKWRCQGCNSSLDLQAHHRTYEFLGDDMHHLDELIALCARCHSAIHVKDESAEQKKTSRAERRKAWKEKHPKKKDRSKDIDVAAVQADLENLPDSFRLTTELVDKCRTARFAFTNATLRAFGMRYPLISGWPVRLLEKTITKEEYRRALEGRYIYNSGTLDCED